MDIKRLKNEIIATIYSFFIVYSVLTMRFRLHYLLNLCGLLQPHFNYNQCLISIVMLRDRLWAIPGRRQVV